MAGLVIATAIILIVRGRGAEFSYSGSAGAHFSFHYMGLHRVPPKQGELARLESMQDGRLMRRLTVEPLEIPAKPNPVATTLPFAARTFTRDYPKDYAGYDLIAEGRGRLNAVGGREAYIVAFTASGATPSPDGSLWIGKTFLVPAHGVEPDRALALELLERVDRPKVAVAVQRFPAGFLLNWPNAFWVRQRTSVDAPSQLQKPLKSFWIGG
jgi:hypothetical protein